MTDNRTDQPSETSHEPAETFDGHNSIAEDGGRVSDWQNIIWREWRNAEDEEYARQTLIRLGGEAVEVLQVEAQDNTSPLQQTVLALLRHIEQMARPVCIRCMLRCKGYFELVSPEISFTYYGCRACHQSRDIADGELVAVLDINMAEAWTVEDGVEVRVNWLKRREVFDFDRVEIVQATDEDVERFAVQVGNDTDIGRQPRYEQIPCLVNLACELSENTLRILDRIFGQVEREQKTTNQVTEKPDACYI